MTLRRVHPLALIAALLLVAGCGGNDTPTDPPKVPAVPTHYAQLSAGAGHTCGLAVWGEAWCRGENGLPRPTGAAVPGLPPVEYIVAGGHHACAMTADGVVYCRGANGQGQLGDGTSTTRHTPVRVGG